MKYIHLISNGDNHDNSNQKQRFVRASACGSFFGEDCNNENEPNNRETCLSIHLVKMYTILAIQIK